MAKKKISDTEAIRQVILQGGHGDYADVAVAVKKNFGITVGSGRVEEVALAMKKEAAAPRSAELKSAQTSLTGTLAKKRPAAASGKSEGGAGGGVDSGKVLAFVESMGGFEAARAAIDELEGTFRRLMK
ncbi:MAG: hypothetical protein R3C19_14910 [Planctomycetaceae bacterium]